MEAKETQPEMKETDVQSMPSPWRSAEIGNLCAALAACQKIIKTPKKGRTANIRSNKGESSSFSYQYADLSDVLAVINEAGPKCGLAHSQIIRPNNEGKLCIVTLLMHESGQWLQSEYKLPPARDNHDMGGNITYGRRYTLSPLFGIASDDDMDHRGAYGAGAEDVAAVPVVAPPAIPRGPRKYVTPVKPRDNDDNVEPEKDKEGPKTAEAEKTPKADTADNTKTSSVEVTTDPKEYKGLDKRLAKKLKEYEEGSLVSVVDGFREFVAERGWFGKNPNLATLPEDFIKQVLDEWDEKIEKPFLAIVQPF